ncbi:MAG: ImmA/IrrE family metallo-endopeptidase [Methylobacterium mesophilicum]|nr:ImmA/IrrE family metallo-endopeptidase [Methylobacterium mesophilicum]
MSELPRPIPTRAFKQQIHDFAERMSLALRFGPGDAIEPLVYRLGGKIALRNPIEFDDQIPESIVVRSTSDFVIYVPSMTSPERDRFTIAHELGHLMLHYPLFAKKHPNVPMVATRWVDETDKVQQRAEWEANWFAAAFLMRKDDFIRISNELKTLEKVAAAFAVSMSAAKIRAENLNITLQ